MFDSATEGPIPLDPARLTDPAEAELSALGRAAADLGDRLAHPVVRADPPRLVPRIGAVVDRRDLGEPAEIVERMALDILAARRDGVHAALIDLTEFGWTAAQAGRWGSAAHDLARRPDFVAADVVERLAARERIEAAWAALPPRIRTLVFGMAEKKPPAITVKWRAVRPEFGLTADLVRLVADGLATVETSTYDEADFQTATYRLTDAGLDLAARDRPRRPSPGEPA